MSLIGDKTISFQLNTCKYVAKGIPSIIIVRIII